MEKSRNDEMMTIKARHNMLESRLDAIRNTALGINASYRKEITDDEGRIDMSKAKAFVQGMLNGLAEYLESEKKTLSPQKRTVYEAYLYCVLLGPSVSRTKYLASNNLCDGILCDEDPMTNESYAPDFSDSFQEIEHELKLAAGCDDIKGLLKQEVGLADFHGRVTPRVLEDSSFFYIMSRGVYWLKSDSGDESANARTYLASPEKIEALSPEDKDLWKKAYWDLLMTDPTDVWMETDRNSEETKKSLDLGPKGVPCTEEGLAEQVYWSGCDSEASFLEEGGFKDRQQYLDYYKAYMEGNAEGLTREERIAIVDRMRKIMGYQPEHLEDALKEYGYTETQWLNRGYGSFDDYLYSQALETLGRCEEAASIRGFDSLEEAEQIDLSCIIDEHSTAEEDMTYSDYAEYVDDDYDDDEWNQQGDEEAEGVRMQQEAVARWKDTLPQDARETFCNAYDDFRFGFFSARFDRKEMVEDIHMMLEVALYDRKLSAAGMGEGYGFVLYQLDRMTEGVERQLRKARLMS